MDLSTYRNLRKREAVSYSYFGICTVHNCHSVFQSFRSKDICFFSVCVADQCNVCRSVRIVFDTYYCCRDSVFLSLEVYDSIFFLSAAAAMSSVILPCALRPAFLFLESRSDFSGVVFVISEKSDPVICLLEGVYGLYVLIPITFSPFISSNYLFHGFAPYIVSEKSRRYERCR